MIGAMALATRDTEAHTVSVGIPARVVKVKPQDQRDLRAARTPDPLVDEPDSASPRQEPSGDQDSSGSSPSAD